MANTPAPSVMCSSVHPGFIVPDIREAVDFYTQKLGFTGGEVWGDPPDFAGVNFGNISVHLMTSSEYPRPASAYFMVDGVDELYEFHRNNGVDIPMPIGNRPYEMRDYNVRDPYGNVLGFGQYAPSNEPALKIERVDVPVRLEKRLAALLQDLADHKGMSIDSTLEETLLHTFEIVGEGVASPHTKTTLRYIEELKDKHGIDYDVHASYRFVE